MHFLYLHRLACNVVIEFKIVKNLWAKLLMVHITNFWSCVCSYTAPSSYCLKRTYICNTKLSYAITYYINKDSYNYWFWLKALVTTASKWNGDRFTTSVKTNIGLPMLRCWSEYTVIWKLYKVTCTNANSLPKLAKKPFFC